MVARATPGVGTIEQSTTTSAQVIFDPIACALYEPVVHHGVGLLVDPDGFLVGARLDGPDLAELCARPLLSLAAAGGASHYWVPGAEEAAAQPGDADGSCLLHFEGEVVGFWAGYASYPLRAAFQQAIEQRSELGYQDYLRLPHVHAQLRLLASRIGDRGLTASLRTTNFETLSPKETLALAEKFGTASWSVAEDSPEFRALQDASLFIELAGLKARGDF